MTILPVLFMCVTSHGIAEWCGPSGFVGLSSAVQLVELVGQTLSQQGSGLSDADPMLHAKRGSLCYDTGSYM